MPYCVSFIYQIGKLNLIKINTPFNVNHDESGRIAFYKIYGDYKDRDKFIISTQDINIFIQGESMGKTSTILSRYKEDKKTIQIGGNAVISFECKLYK